ncbi:MAG: hypothetical protein ABI867_27495 [Kofleriaceae bacterium]
MMRIVVAVGLFGIGCGSDNPAVDAGVVDAAIDADEGSGVRVQLEIRGVRDPMFATLRDDEDDQELLITEDSEAALRFSRRLPEGRAYAITLAGSQTCIPDGSLEGTVQTSDVTVSITCDGVIDLQSISTGDPDVPLRFFPRFDPLITAYAKVTAPLLVDPGTTTSLVASARYVPDVAVSPSQITWPAGAVAASVTVDRAPFGASTTTMMLTRDLVQEAFGKAPAPVATDHLGGITDITYRGLGGGAIALSGGTVVVGAPGVFPVVGLGAAYVFRRSGGHWALEATLAAPVANTNFGTAVAIDGDTIAVGAPKDGNGATYVFRRIGTTWTRTDTLRPVLTSGMADGAMFGNSVAISGAYLVAGAWGNGNTTAGNNLGDGAAFVFHDDGASGFSLAQTLVPAGSDEAFGSAIAIAGDRLAIGAPGDAATGVYVYARAGTSWLQDGAKLPGTAGSRFGEAVAIHGDLLVVGAPYDDNAGGFDQGNAFVYHRDATWVRTTTLVAPTQSAARFGFAVAVYGHHVVVGAPFEDAGSPARVSAGRVHYFRCSAAGVCPAAEVKVTASNPSNQAFFGTSLALDHLTIATGAPNEDSGATDSGAFYVFR